MLLWAAAGAAGCGPAAPGPPACQSGCPEGCTPGEWVSGGGVLYTGERRPAWRPCFCPRGTWIPVCPGTYLMGADPRSHTHAGEHEVTLTRGFEVRATEVTQAEFEAVMGYNPSKFVDGVGYPFDPCGPDCPVEQVSWHEAAAYCNALSAEAGHAPCYSCSGEGQEVRCERDSAYATPYECEGYRLPTSAEWEYAARAGSTGETYNGDIIGALDEGCDPAPTLAEIAWYCGHRDGVSSTHPVAQLMPNAWGLFDTLGNVEEWTDDLGCSLREEELGRCAPASDRYRNNDPLVDPFWEPTFYDGPEVGIARGGCWASTIEGCRAPAGGGGSRDGIALATGLRIYTIGIRPFRTRLDIAAEEDE